MDSNAIIALALPSPNSQRLLQVSARNPSQCDAEVSKDFLKFMKTLLEIYLSPADFIFVTSIISVKLFELV